MSVLNNGSIDKVCRTCLYKGEDMNFLDGIVESFQISLGDVLMCCSKITESNELPNQICSDCTMQLLNAYNFKLKCEESDKVLVNFLSKNSQEIEPYESDLEQNDDVSQDPIHIQLIDTKEAQTDSVQGPPEDNQVRIKPEITIAFADEIVSDAKNKFRCEVCQNTYTHKKSLIRHLNKAHNANISNRCKICNKVFAKGTQLESHMAKHENDEVFTCTICEEEFESKLQLKTHRTTHLRKLQMKVAGKNNVKLESKEADTSLCSPNGPKIIQCKICHEHFTKFEKLRQHLTHHTTKEPFDSKLYSISTECGIELSLSDSETDNDDDENDDFDHKPTKQYVCEICYKVFNRRYKILYHQKNDHDHVELQHQCTKCLWKYASKQLLSSHLKSQCDNEYKLFSCNECNMKFMWTENLELHKNSRHSSEAIEKNRKELKTEKGFVCETCNKKFVRYEHLERHKTIHLPNDKKFECTICEKRFNRKDNMRSHMRIHNANRDKDDKHLCVYCGRGFTNSSNLIVHMRRHTGDKPYKCDFCGKGFPRSSDLQCHRRTHTGEKPCLCTICGKGFSRSNKLVRHMRIHTGVRPYKCTYCDRAFTQSNDLTLHIRRHTGDKPYVCGVCGERFIQGTALQTHRRVKEHYEGPNHSAPFSSISVNNPNRMNFANRVDQIGMPKVDTAQPVEIKPVGRAGNFRTSCISATAERDETKTSVLIDTAATESELSHAMPFIQLVYHDEQF